MDTEVKIGEIAVAKSPDNLIASAVGSCLVITIYDPKLKIGALAHAMLPSRGASRATHHEIRDTQYTSRDTRYVNTAIDEILRQLNTLGAKGEDLEAKLIGGANMFPALKSDIALDNISCAKEKLSKEGIKIVGESVGGNQGRSVEFSISSGIVTVKIKF